MWRTLLKRWSGFCLCCTVPLFPISPSSPSLWIDGEEAAVMRRHPVRFSGKLFELLPPPPPPLFVRKTPDDWVEVYPGGLPAALVPGSVGYLHGCLVWTRDWTHHTEQCDVAHGLRQSPFQPPPGELLLKCKALCFHHIMLASRL